MTGARDLPTLLAGLVGDPYPRLTWYGEDDERVELSGHVLANWATKSAGLLVDEVDARPGTRLALDLPVHWRAAVWALAGWRTGALVLPAPGRVSADVVVTHRPAACPVEAADVVAVALPALARAVPDLPRGVIDGAAVQTYPDVLGPVLPPSPQDPALGLGDGPVPYARLLETGRTGRPERRLLTPTDLGAMLTQMLATWADGGSVVLCDPAVATALAADPTRHERLVATERVTASGVAPVTASVTAAATSSVTARRPGRPSPRR